MYFIAKRSQKKFDSTTNLPGSTGSWCCLCTRNQYHPRYRIARLLNRLHYQRPFVSLTGQLLLPFALKQIEVAIH